jgi:sugar phosphate isomerase/epimerase
VPKISIGTWAFGAYSEHPIEFGAMLDRLAELRFDGVDFGAFDPHPSPDTVDDIDALAEVFTSRGLEVAAVAAGFGERGFLRSDDSDAYLTAVDKNLELCRRLGARRLIVNTLDPPETPYEVGLDLATGRLLRCWREAARRADGAGVELTWEFEPCWAFNEPEQVIAIAHELHGPGFGVLYDTAHAHTVSEVGARHVGVAKPLTGGQLELLERLAGTINHIHLLDSDGSIHDHPESPERTTVHVPFGYGEVSFDRVVPALAHAAPDAEWWTVDLCFWPDAWAATAHAKAFVDRLVDKLTHATPQP